MEGFSQEQIAMLTTAIALAIRIQNMMLIITFCVASYNKRCTKIESVKDPTIVIMRNIPLKERCLNLIRLKQFMKL